MALPQITATGNLTEDPVLRHTKSGDPVVNLRLACNERKKDDQGNWTDGRTVYLSVSAWRTLADVAVEELAKGMEITVTGRLSTREYTTQAGETRTSVEIDADTIARTLGRRKASAPSATAFAYDESDPF